MTAGVEASKVNGAVPGLVTVTVEVGEDVPVCSDPKETRSGDAENAEVVPVPVRVTVCGLPAALSTNRSCAVLAPVEVGATRMFTVQVPAAATLVPVQVSSPRENWSG